MTENVSGRASRAERRKSCGGTTTPPPPPSAGVDNISSRRVVDREGGGVKVSVCSLQRVPASRPTAGKQTLRPPTAAVEAAVEEGRGGAATAEVTVVGSTRGWEKRVDDGNGVAATHSKDKNDDDVDHHSHHRDGQERGGAEGGSAAEGCWRGRWRREGGLYVAGGVEGDGSDDGTVSSPESDGVDVAMDVLVSTPTSSGLGKASRGVGVGEDDECGGAAMAAAAASEKSVAEGGVGRSMGVRVEGREEEEEEGDGPVACMLLFDSTKGHRSQEFFRKIRK